MEHNYDNLVAWLDKTGLEKVQKSFHDMTGMSAKTIDMAGNLLIPKIGESAFCDEIVAGCPMTCELCRQCQKYGAREAKKVVDNIFYYCHMGLVEFSAPIIIDGEMAAVFVGGMVFEKAPREDRIRALAELYELDADELWNAARKIPVVGTDSIKKGSEFLYNISDIVAGNADSRIQMDKAGKELERASKLKTDFLANMSHEIRTPMNAVIGLTDIALQEEMSEAASGYVKQIQNSGRALLNIINDILDYSKISSGKMDIIEDEYDPFELIKDLTVIISNRLKDKEKDVAFLVFMDPGVPKKLIGDAQRIQQILINIANNAVKFTNKGDIRIIVSVTKTAADEVLMTAVVKDTGIGIRNEDQKKLFNSFTQVDSKRNRNVEGTGLGLAIVKQLVDLMGGTVSLDSVYGKGSAFTVSIPQKIADASFGVKLQTPEKYACLGIISNSEIAENFQRISDSMGVSTQVFIPEVGTKAVMDKWLSDRTGREKFVIIDQDTVKRGNLKDIDFKSQEYSEVKFVLLLDAYAEEKAYKEYGFYKIIRKPILCTSLAKVFESDRQKNVAGAADAKLVGFKAPTAKILVVDDNKTNMIVAEKLLKMLDVEVDKAYSGKEAIEKIMVREKLKREDFYDIIFMDHMMPEIDGIDTTRIIRRFYPKLNVIPIIALSANAMADAKKMFLDEGMNDFLAKPIDRKMLNQKVLQWLPKEKIIYE